ncbi:hypothetical protein C9J44_10765 [Photobacterium sp. GB-27]|uniref:hypothetical protein n=1 Tax=Photobacterium sp. GB-27 TaxID=2022109 RepID=UPI000D1720AE|nr:hypothetical protein [Photobacterium sp. GB-27]PSV36103.1 hypothetical protein C9J44_10765 [Photobacterium sp. GB-27]
MSKNLDDEVVECILNHSGIQKENPFDYAIEGALSEWIQLLLVIERIKLNPTAFKKLQKIAQFTRTFLSNDKVEKQTYCRHDRDNFSSNKVRPSYNRQMLKKWNSLDDFFKTLDEGKKLNVFLTKANIVNKSSNELLIHVIAEICDDLSFTWDNLNTDRINYPHSMILKGFIEGNKILESIDELISFDSKRVQEIKKEAVSKFILKVKDGNSNFPYNIDIIKSLKYRKDFVGSINDAIYRELLTETVKLVRKISCSAHLNIDDDHSFLGMRSFFKEHIEVKRSGNGIDIHLSDEILLNAFNFREEEELFNRLNSYFEDHIIDNNRLDSYINDDIKRNKSPHERDYITRKLIEKIENYNSWIESQNNYILNKKLKLPINIILRGIKFSYWYQEYIIKNKKNILNGATEYRKELKLETKELTIKQSYEFIKKIAKNDLNLIIKEQTKERLYTINEFDMLLLKPLNNSMYDNIKEYNNQLGEIFKINCITYDFDEVISTYKAIELLVSEHEDDNISYSKAYEKVFNDKYDEYYKYEKIKQIKKSELKSLLKFNFEIK